MCSVGPGEALQAWAKDCSHQAWNILEVGYLSIPSPPGQIGSRSCLLRWHPAHAHRMKDRLLGSPVPEERVGHAAVEDPFGSWGKRGRPVPVADSSKCSCWQSASCCLSRRGTREWGAGKRTWGSLLLQRQSQEQVQ